MAVVPVQGRAKHAGRFGHFQSAAGAESLQEVAVVVRRVVPDTFDRAACDVGDGALDWAAVYEAIYSCCHAIGCCT